jgi:di/tricarboxylate transporter
MAVARRARLAEAGRMTSSHVIGGALFCAFVGFWIGRALFVWLLDLDRPYGLLLAAAVAVVGAVIGAAAGREEARKKSG